MPNKIYNAWRITSWNGEDHTRGNIRVCYIPSDHTNLHPQGACHKPFELDVHGLHSRTNSTVLAKRRKIANANSQR